MRGRLRAAKIGREVQKMNWDGTAIHQPQFYARVVYEYTVDGISYSSERIGYGIVITDSDEQGIRSSLAGRHWRPGVEVSVYYDPLNPSESVLLPGSSVSTFLVPAGGIIMVLVGTLILLSNRV